MSKRRVDLSGDAGDGLTHNPFAALRPGSPQPGAPGPGAHPTAGPEPVEGEREGASALARSDWLVRKERKGRGGKVVTIVSPRAGETEARLAEVARSLGQRLGTGARAKGDHIVVQGELSGRVRDLLEADGARVTVGS